MRCSFHAYLVSSPPPGDDKHTDYVANDAAAIRQSEKHPQQTHDGRVNAEIFRNAAAHPGDFLIVIG